MSGSARKLQRAKLKREGKLIHKKAIARKMGITVADLNRRLKDREKKLKMMEGGVENG